MPLVALKTSPWTCLKFVQMQNNCLDLFYSVIKADKSIYSNFRVASVSGIQDSQTRINIFILLPKLGLVQNFPIPISASFLYFKEWWKKNPISLSAFSYFLNSFIAQFWFLLCRFMQTISALRVTHNFFAYFFYFISFWGHRGKNI